MYGMGEGQIRVTELQQCASKQLSLGNITPEKFATLDQPIVN